MYDKIEKLIAQGVTCDNDTKKTRFFKQFANLYRLDVLKPSLDLIITLLHNDRVKFLVIASKDDAYGDTVTHGVCKTKFVTADHSSFREKYQSKEYEISLYNLSIEIIMHEITHALELESELNIAQDFIPAIEKDLKSPNKAHIMIRNAVSTILYDEIELYDKSEVNSELLARFFQLLAMGKEVHSIANTQYHFYSSEIMELFPNTMMWIYGIFNQKLLQKINHNIAQQTQEFHKWIITQKVKKDFAIDSIFDDSNKPSWKNKIKSNFD